MPIIASTGGYSLLWRFGSGTPPQANTFPVQLGADLDDIATALTTINQTKATTYLGSVTAAANVVQDTTIIAANSTAYRSFELVLRNILPDTANVAVQLQVQSGGIFQNTSYQDSILQVTTAIALTAFTIFGTVPGLCGKLFVSGLNGTSAPKPWLIDTAYNSGAPVTAPVRTAGVGYWRNNAAITGFQIISSPGNIASGSVDIYGII